MADCSAMTLTTLLPILTSYFCLLLGKGCYWALHSKCAGMFENGSFLRRRRRFKLKQSELQNQSTDQQEQVSANLPQSICEQQRSTPCQSPRSMNSLSPVSQTSASPLYHPAMSLSAQPTTNHISRSPIHDDSANSLTAYYQMLMQYYTMLGMNNLITQQAAAVPTNFTPASMNYYDHLLNFSKLNSLQLRQSSGYESHSERGSPVSSVSDSDLMAERALDLSFKYGHQ